MASGSNWTVIGESTFAWEREAIAFVRSQFPSQEPYRAWSNFEFIADDGTINEVDLLIFTPHGFFLVETKSRPGRLKGDAGTWTWESNGKKTTIDNPLLLANLKAKKLRSLLQRQKACKGKGHLPYVEALVFCSDPSLECLLQGTARYHVCLRDRAAEGDRPARTGIMAAIKRRECDGLDSHPKGTHDRPTLRIVAQALEQAGIRPTQRSRKVSDYQLDHLINEGPGFQDWQATHSALQSIRRRVRIYNIRAGASADERRTIERAARREAEILETLQHPGILRREGFTEHELGPALIFEHESVAMRLDHFIAQRHEQLGMAQRLDLLRQIAEVIRFAHEKRVIHRALSPQSVLVIPLAVEDGTSKVAVRSANVAGTFASPRSFRGAKGDNDRSQIKIFNWQVGSRSISRGESGTTSKESRLVSATSHVDRLVDDMTTAYMAPEAISDPENVGEHLDIFSLGAIAYHLISGIPPATNGLDLSNKLRDTQGLQISSVVNGASQQLQELIQWSTHPDVTNRMGLLSTVDDFLEFLEKVEEEARSADREPVVEDPDQANKGDLLPGDYRVVRRIGKGGVSIAFLVEREGTQYIMKVASSPENNQRLRDEAEVLDKLRHSNIVQYLGSVEIGDRQAFLMKPVMVTVNDAPEIETLGRRLGKEGRLNIDLLQRFGEALLDVVKYLEEQGINHRDIKPDNIAVGHIGASKHLNLVLFDFSLSRTPPENIRAGTTGYLDPFLPIREPKRWDLYAERYAVAITLFEMATGPRNAPKWGDGNSDPSHLTCDATIDGNLLDPSLRDSLTEFFEKAFRRDIKKRFDNIVDMRDEWRACFQAVDEEVSLSDHENPEDLEQLLAFATLDTQIAELGLGTRATNTLDRANLITVEDLLTVPLRKILRLRGVGNKTRLEIAQAGCRIRDIFSEHSSHASRILEHCDDRYVQNLAQAVTGKLGGKVGVAPRIFLKKLVADVLDRIDLHEDFDPRQDYALTIEDVELKGVERQAMGATDVDEIELEL